MCKEYNERQEGIYDEEFNEQEFDKRIKEAERLQEIDKKIIAEGDIF